MKKTILLLAQTLIFLTSVVYSLEPFLTIDNEYAGPVYEVRFSYDYGTFMIVQKQKIRYFNTTVWLIKNEQKIPPEISKYYMFNATTDNKHLLVVTGPLRLYNYNISDWSKKVPHFPFVSRMGAVTTIYDFGYTVDILRNDNVALLYYLFFTEPSNNTAWREFDAGAYHYDITTNEVIESFSGGYIVKTNLAQTRYLTFLYVYTLIRNSSGDFEGSSDEQWKIIDENNRVIQEIPSNIFDDKIALMSLDENNGIYLFKKDSSIWYYNGKSANRIISFSDSTNYLFNNLDSIKNIYYYEKADMFIAHTKNKLLLFENKTFRILDEYKSDSTIWRLLLNPRNNQLVLCDKNGNINIFLLNKYTNIDSPKETITKIFPNPATDFIDVILSERSEAKTAEGSGVANPFLNVNIYDVLGNVVVDTPPGPLLIEGERIRLDVSDLSAGVYFVRVGGRMYKFVKM